jgi:hypothetical protein
MGILDDQSLRKSITVVPIAAVALTLIVLHHPARAIAGSETTPDRTVQPDEAGDILTLRRGVGGGARVGGVWSGGRMAGGRAGGARVEAGGGRRRAGSGQRWRVISTAGT